jgi:hypothetical protein
MRSYHYWDVGPSSGAFEETAVLLNQGERLRNIWHIVATLLLTTCVIIPSLSISSSFAASLQEVGEPDTLRSQYYLRLGTEDELEFYVHIWGQVNKPGLYAVRDGTDLVALLAMAGGPTEDAKLTHITLVRGIGQGKGSIRVDVQEYVESGRSSEIPVLHPGDTVIVPAKFTHTLFRLSGFLSVLALVANVIVNATVR